MDSEIRKTLKVLKNGGIILYPTDTVWGLGCDALNARAIEQIYKIKERPNTKSLIVLLDTFELLKKYVKNVPDIVEDLILSMDKPVTVIYENAINLPKNVIAPDGSVAIRVVRDQFCSRLIKEFGRPLISSSANISGEPTPLVFSQIDRKIIDNVDYVVQLLHSKFNQAKTSTIIKLHNDGSYQIIRN
ncbi:MAG: threonylcarbamoyl-AMP synthase [Lentimicrobium sp.]|nr:threonylcarbamoyl-AMP synthase [Lentimicrobium sp.]